MQGDRPTGIIPRSPGRYKRPPGDWCDCGMAGGNPLWSSPAGSRSAAAGPSAASVWLTGCLGRRRRMAIGYHLPERGWVFLRSAISRRMRYFSFGYPTFVPTSVSLLGSQRSFPPNRAIFPSWYSLW